MSNPQLSRRTWFAFAGSGALATGALAAAPLASAATPAVTPAAIPDTGMQVITLGTAAGPIIRGPRMGIATAVVVDGNIYLVDFGLGAARQSVNAGLKMQNLKAVFLTHLHSDHVSELPALFFYNWGTASNGIVSPVDVWGPGPARLPRGARPQVKPARGGTSSLIDDLLQTYSYDINVRVYDEARTPLNDLIHGKDIDLPRSVKADAENPTPDMEPFEIYRDDHVTVSTVLVHHPPVFPAYGFRFDSAHGSVTVSGDTTAHPNLVRLAQGTDILVHEAIDTAYYLSLPNLTPEYVEHIASSHTDITDVGTVAQQAGAKQLVLSHLGGLFTQAQAAPAEEDFDGPVTLAADGQIFSV